MQERKPLSIQTIIYDAIIIGAGAAGLFCAGQLAQAGKKVLVLEHGEKIGGKILISGGGRCNFTNQKVSFQNFVSQNPNFARSALSQYSEQDFIALVEKYQIPYYEKTLGQLFVDKQGGAKLILEMLLQEANAAKIKTACEISTINSDDTFKVETNLGAFNARNLIIATGGKSIPKMGATGFAYKIAEQFDINIINPAPALVPLTFTGDKNAWIIELAGVSLPVKVKAKKIGFDESLLFTHKGLSGPAILQISNYINAGDSFNIDLAPNHDLEALLLNAKTRQPNAKISSILNEFFPSRLAHFLGSQAPIGQLKDIAIKELAQKLHNYPFIASGTEGFAKAEVTKGGIDTNELNQKTMEAKKQTGLYFIGECVDITGWLGGYNFQWAWSSAYACAMGIIGK